MLQGSKMIMYDKKCILYTVCILCLEFPGLFWYLVRVICESEYMYQNSFMLTFNL